MQPCRFSYNTQHTVYCHGLLSFLILMHNYLTINRRDSLRCCNFKKAFKSLSPAPNRQQCQEFNKVDWQYKQINGPIGFHLLPASSCLCMMILLYTVLYLEAQTIFDPTFSSYRISFITCNVFSAESQCVH